MMPTVSVDLSISSSWARALRKLCVWVGASLRSLKDVPGYMI